MPIDLLIAIIIIFVAVGVSLFFFFKSKKGKEVLKQREAELAKREEEAKHKMYEVSILNELGDKIGYSLNVQNAIEIIIKSLHEILNYSSVSYMIPFPEKIIFRTYLENQVPTRFIDTVRGEMLQSLSLLLGQDISFVKTEDNLWGANLNDDSENNLGSFFNIPLVISGRVAGLMTVANTETNCYSEKQINLLYKMSGQACDAVTRLQNVVDSENSKLNAMVASMTDGVIMTDMDYRILVVNPAAKKALGLENKNNLSTLDFTDALSGKIDLKDKIEEGIRLDKVFISDEISLSTGYFKIGVAPVKDNWKKLGCVVIFRDITREKEVERIKEDFTSMIVHELRSPLDSIKKMMALMRTSEVKKSEREGCYQMVYSSSSDMLELVNNLLDIAKIEAGKFELKKEKSDIKSLIQSRILFFDIASKDAKLKLTSCLGKNLPEAVEFDPHTVSQVLNNLISNAIKFTKENGTITVQALIHKKGESVKKEAIEAGVSWFIDDDFLDIPDSLFLAVTDNGIGIAKDQIGKLFNKFIQAKSVFAKSGGTGLGLAITKSIVDSHGGIVGAKSIEGQGSTFYFTLPIN